VSGLGEKAKTTWDALAPAYAAAAARPDSLDRLLDFPCQQRLIGDVGGKRILDLGCGNGYKPIQFAENGAAEVVGLDISEPFIAALQTQPTPPNIRWIRADVADLDCMAELAEGYFDLVTVLCASLGPDAARTMRSIRRLLKPTGALVWTLAHPVRWAVERSERDDVPVGRGYQDRSLMSYPSSWDSSVQVTHPTSRFSDAVNAFAAAGFFIEACEEPELSAEQATAFPHKQQWLDKYVGLLAFRARPVDARPPLDCGVMKSDCDWA